MQSKRNRVRQFLHFNIWVILLDIVAFCVSYLLTLYIRMYVNGFFRYGEFYIGYFWKYIPYYIAASVVVFWAFRLYGGIWQYAGLHDFNRLIVANAVTAVMNVGISMLVIHFIPNKEYVIRMPNSYYILGAIIQFFFTSFIRFFYRFFSEERKRINRKHGVSTMLVGTGETARIVRSQLENDLDSGVNINCIFTYRDSESGRLQDGIPIVSNLNELRNHFENYHIKRVILADSIMPMSVREQIRSTCQEAKVEVQDFSGFLRYDNSILSFQKLLECVDGKVSVLQDGKITTYDNSEQALMTITGKHDVRSVSIRDNTIFIELISYKVKPLVVFFITNRPDVALTAEKYGVDRIWIDLETLGKEDRQRNMNTVKSDHKISDIREIKPLLTRAEVLVRINHWNENSQQEIDDVIAAGADMIMLPYWKTVEEVKNFVRAVDGRVKTSLLLETKEAVECLDDVLMVGGFDEIHIGLNDLHLSYGMTFMFELLSDGTVEKLCNKIKRYGIPYGFGGIAKLGEGMLHSERIIMEHYRLGSTRAILSRTFCDCSKITDINEIDKVFRENMEALREYELSMANTTQEEFVRNKVEISKAVDEIVERINAVRYSGTFAD